MSNNYYIAWLNCIRYRKGFLTPARMIRTASHIISTYNYIFSKGGFGTGKNL